MSSSLRAPEGRTVADLLFENQWNECTMNAILGRSIYMYELLMISDGPCSP